MALVQAKKRLYMTASVLAFVRRHVVMFGVVKFCSGAVIGLRLSV